MAAALLAVHAIATASALATTPRTTLLDAIAPLERGFRASRDERRAVTAAIDALAAAAPQQAVPDISGDWELVYTDAPDILGLDVQVRLTRTSSHSATHSLTCMLHRRCAGASPPP